MQSLYRTIFQKAWEIMLKFKYLLILGLFSSLIISDGEFSMVVRGFDVSTWQQAGLENLRDMYNSGFFHRFYANFLQLVQKDPLGFSGYASLGLVIILAVIVMVVLAQSSLVYAINTHDKNRKTGLGDSLKQGKKFFWKALGVQLMSRLTIYFLFIVITIPLLAWVLWQDAVNFVATLVFFIIVIPLSVIISFIGKYALISVVTRGKGAINAFYEGVGLFKKHWFVSIEMAVLLFLIHFAALFALIVIGSLAALPFVLLAMLSLFLGSNAFALLFVFLIAVIVVFLLAVFSGGLAVFQFASWTLLFNELIRGKAVAKLERLLGTGAGARTGATLTVSKKK